MKRILLITLIIALIWICPSQAANKFFWATGLIGGGSSLDAIDGGLLTDGDMAIVGYDNGGTYEFYPYRLEDYAVNPPDESSPNTITPNTNSGNKRWKLLEVYAAGFPSLVDADVPDVLTLTGIILANASTLTLPTAFPTFEGGLFSCDEGGVCGWTNPTAISSEIPYSGELTTEQVACWDLTTIPGSNLLKSCGTKTIDNSSVDAVALLCKDNTNQIVDCTLSGLTITGTTAPEIGITDDYVYMPLSTFTAEGDVPVGYSSGNVTVITKGANNTFFGVSNAGILGFHSSFNPVLVSAPSTNDSYSGTVASFVAGETLAFGDVVYCRRGPGGAGECATTAHCCYKYDADDTTGTPDYKTYPPRAIAVAAITKLSAGSFLVHGIIRHNEFAEGITNDQDEGAIVYGSVTAGAIELTRPAVSGNMVAILGYIIEENVLFFNPSHILVEVP